MIVFHTCLWIGFGLVVAGLYLIAGAGLACLVAGVILFVAGGLGLQRDGA